MKYSKLFFAASFIFAAGTSQATTYNLNNLAIGDNYLSGSAVSNVLVSNGNFADIFNFSIGANSGVDVSAGTLNFGKFNIIDTTFKYTLYSGINELASGINNGGFTIAALGSGTYHLDVLGTATGSKGGQYNGAITISPVPEAETYSMMLLGLGLIGFIARRSKQNQA